MFDGRAGPGVLDVVVLLHVIVDTVTHDTHDHSSEPCRTTLVVRHQQMPIQECAELISDWPC